MADKTVISVVISKMTSEVDLNTVWSNNEVSTSYVNSTYLSNHEHLSTQLNWYKVGRFRNLIFGSAIVSALTNSLDSWIEKWIWSRFPFEQMSLHLG